MWNKVKLIKTEEDRVEHTPWGKEPNFKLTFDFLFKVGHLNELGNIWQGSNEGKKRQFILLLLGSHNVRKNKIIYGQLITHLNEAEHLSL